ncbi:MAG: hypothetical protein AB1938_03350 [Myxococcota bacterium]
MKPASAGVPFGHLLRAGVVGVVCGLAAQGCFDPLYESGQPLEDTWVVCCDGAFLDTCLCENTATCQQAFAVCAGGMCSRGTSCGGTADGGAGGGAGTGGGTGGASGGGSGGGGGGFGGGTGGGAGGGGGGFLDAGVQDGGVSDAGVEDGGTGGGTGGGFGGGAGGGAGGGFGGGSGGGGPTRYEPCCVNGAVTSCVCPASGCLGLTFKPCAAGRCVAAGASCP